jgi:hypothetical protein
MAGTTTEAWIGQPIELWVQLGNGQHVSGTLEGVDDKGVRRRARSGTKAT